MLLQGQQGCAYEDGQSACTPHCAGRIPRGWLTVGRFHGFWESRVSSSSFSSSVCRDPGLCVGRQFLLHSSQLSWPPLLCGEAAAMGRHRELTPGQEALPAGGEAPARPLTNPIGLS